MERVAEGGVAAGGTISGALEVARPDALLIGTKAALVKGRPGTMCRSFSTAGQLEGSSTGSRCSLNFAQSNGFTFVSLTTMGFGNLIPMTAPASMVCIKSAVEATFDIASVMGGRAAIQGSWPAPRERARRPGPTSPVVVGIGIGGLKRPHRAEGKAGEPPRKR